MALNHTERVALVDMTTGNVCTCTVPVMQELRLWADERNSTGRAIQCNGCGRGVHITNPLHPDHHILEASAS